jgi:hypothetical protein
LPANTPENAPIALSATSLATTPKQYRVISIEPEGDDDQNELIRVSAVEIYPTKWAESDAIEESEILSQQPNKTVPSPENLTLALGEYQAAYQSKRIVTASWDRPSTPWFNGFKVTYKLNNGPEILLAANTQESFAEIKEPQDGSYEFRVYTLDRRGGISLPEKGVIILGDTPPPGGSVLRVSESAITITSDTNGTPIENELPYEGWAVYQVGEVDYSSETTWDINCYGCTSTIDTDGYWEITAVSQTPAKMIITGEYNGLTLTHTINILKTDNQTPTGGGGGGGQLTVISGFASVSATTYPSDPTPIGVVNSGSAGEIEFTTSLSYKGTNITLVGKQVYRLAGGGAWTDVAAETVGSEATMEIDNTGWKPIVIQSPGDLTIGPDLVTGLTASTDYEFGVLLRLQSGAASTTPTGTVTGEGSV